MRRLVILGALVAAVLAALPAIAPAHAASSGSIAFVRGGDIWTIAPGGGSAKRLTGGGRDDGCPAWSPDHKTVAFVRMPKEWGDTPTICTVSAAGGASHAVKYSDDIGDTDFHFIPSVAYSPDGSKLAFSDMYQLSAGGDNKPEHNRLVVIDLKTGKTTVLIKRLGGFDGAIDAGWSLSWSPDGKSLLVAQGAMDSEGGQTRVFTIATRHLRKLPIANASHADWSPDGNAIVLSTATQMRTSILVARTSGAVIRTLLRGRGWQATPASPAYKDACYSTDGGRIAYTVDSWTGDTGRSVWIMNADGSGRRRLTSGEAPAWR